MLSSSLPQPQSPSALAQRAGQGRGDWRGGLPSPVVSRLARLWRPLIYFWLTLLLSWLGASFITLLVTAGQSDMPELPVVQVALEQPWLLAGVLGLVALLTLAAYPAHQARHP